MVASGHVLGLAFLMKNVLVCGGLYVRPAGTTVSGVSPLANAAADTITLNVEPGGKVSEKARFCSGLFGVVSSFWYAADAAVVLWSANGFGSKLGIETAARIPPVF